MRRIERASAFKRDYRRVAATPKHRKDLDPLLRAVLTKLVVDLPLPEKNRDHPLTGNWVGYRDCHLKPDLLLIYKNSEEGVLRLARLGSHGELFE